MQLISDTKPKYTLLTDDCAIDGTGDDELGLSPIARHIAKTLAEVPCERGFVAAITGPWGSGKSSCINFCKEQWSRMTESQSSIPAPLIVEFSPWLYNERADLTRAFFEQFYAGVKTGLGRKAKAFSRKLAAFASPIIAETGVPGAKAISKALDTALPAQDVRKEIDKCLDELKSRVIVIIDDLDRLPADEVVEVLRLVKSVAAFKNTVFLLAFDHNNVANAVQSRGHSESGAQYLEKIIQFAWPLPPPTTSQLRRMLEGRLRMAIPEDIRNQPDIELPFESLWYEGLRYVLTTPRDIKRVVSSFTICFEHVKDEVHPIDFLAVETLRVLHPTVYQRLAMDHRWRSSNELVYDTMQTGPSRETVDEAIGSTSTIGGNDQSRGLNGILAYLNGSQLLRGFRGQHRAHAYFWLALPQGVPSSDDVMQFMSLCGNADQLTDKLTELMTDQSPAYDLMYLLIALEDESGISPAGRQAIIYGLFRTAHLAGSFKSGSFEESLGSTMRRFILHFFEEAAFPTTDEVMGYGLDNCTSLGLLENLLLRCKVGSPETKPVYGDIYLSPERIQQLQLEFCKLCKGRAVDGVILGVSEFHSILYRWLEWAGDREVSDALAPIWQDDGLILRFINATQGCIYSSDGTSTPYYDAKIVPRITNLESVKDRVVRMLNGSLSEHDRSLAELFLQGYEIHIRGGDPTLLGSSRSRRLRS